MDTRRCVIGCLYYSFSIFFQHLLGLAHRSFPCMFFSAPALSATVIYQLPWNFWVPLRNSLVSFLIRSQIAQLANNPTHVYFPRTFPACQLSLGRYLAVYQDILRPAGLEIRNKIAPLFLHSSTITNGLFREYLPLNQIINDYTKGQELNFSVTVPCTP